jgi:hypothetical protein
VSYTYVYKGQQYDVVGETVSLPANTGTVQLKPFADSEADSVLQDSEQVQQAFTRKDTTDDFTGYEYEYVIEPRTGQITFPNRVRGWRGIKADYRVADWRTIMEERTIPGTDDVDPALSGRVQLTLNFVKQRNVYRDDEDVVWLGLPGSESDPSDPFNKTSGRVSVLAVDEDNGGVILAEGDHYAVDYRNGYVKFDVDRYPNLAGHRVRIFYQADGDFALVPQKAAATYLFSSNQAPQYLEYRFAMDSEKGSGVTGAYLVFPRSEVTKSVTVDYSFKLKNPPVGYENTRFQKIGQMGTIHFTGPGVLPNINRPDVWGPAFCLSDTDGDDLEDPAVYIGGQGYYLDPNTVYVDRMRGGSLKIICIWRGQQLWHTEEGSTYLIQAEGARR